MYIFFTSIIMFLQFLILIKIYVSYYSVDLYPRLEVGVKLLPQQKNYIKMDKIFQRWQSIKLNIKDRKREKESKILKMMGNKVCIKERCNAYLYRVHHRARPRSHHRNYHRHSHSHLRFMKHMVQMESVSVTYHRDFNTVKNLKKKCIYTIAIIKKKFRLFDEIFQFEKNVIQRSKDRQD